MHKTFFDILHKCSYVPVIIRRFIEPLFKHAATDRARKPNETMHMLHVLGAILLAFTLWPGSAMGGPYAGSKACGGCHAEQYERFTSHSKKSVSWSSVAIMASDLKPFELEQCYGCHTTGHGQGGFVSIEQTPQLADVGCETCHGPGGSMPHAEIPLSSKEPPALKPAGSATIPSE